MSESYGFFALAFRQRYISRWALMRNTERESLSEHSAQCAMTAHCLALINREIFKGDANPEKVALFALYHDCSEVMCGDLPTPVKYSSPEMRKIFAGIEEKSALSLLSKLPSELKPEYEPLLTGQTDALTERLVKTADKLCALIKCELELSCGNREFAQAKSSTLEILKTYKSDELDYFMEYFLPAFSETLDELNK